MDEGAYNQKPKNKLFKVLVNLLVTLVSAVIIFLVAYIMLINPCGLPVEYAVGSIDPRFKISSSEVSAELNDAATRWNISLGKAVFRYNPDAILKINLVYDERQQKLDQTMAKIAEFDAENGSIDEFRNKVEALSSQYEKDLSAYNSKVSYWNSLGGAPQQIYTQLNSERLSLEKRRLDINKMASLLNSQIAENNSNVADFNSQLEKDRNKIITTGEYFSDGSKINIYTFGKKEELRLVLMHELAHALSKEHDSDPKSILYPVLQEQDLADPLPTQEDRDLVTGLCRINSRFILKFPALDIIAKKFSALVTNTSSQY